MSVNPIIIQSTGPHIVVRCLWFLAVGFWLGGVVSMLAWALVVSLIGLPLGLWLINRLPRLMTLRPQNQWHLEGNILRQGQLQRGFLGRALYFVAIGVWLSAVWMALAYAAFCTLVGIPLAFWMYGHVGAVTTLYKS